ncbi:Uncharacterised protein [Vibrio cholerae]|nr:Uncharacterised protein [Vibrio cholerae]
MEKLPSTPPMCGQVVLRKTLPAAAPFFRVLCHLKTAANHVSAPNDLDPVTSRYNGHCSVNAVYLHAVADSLARFSTR